MIAGAVAISSSAIVTKLLDRAAPPRQPREPLILGIIVVEDVFLALVPRASSNRCSATPMDAGDIVSIAAASRSCSAWPPWPGAARRWWAGCSTTDDDELLTIVCRRSRGARGGRGRGARRLGRDRRVHGRSRARRDRSAPRIERLVLPLRDVFAASSSSSSASGSTRRPRLAWSGRSSRRVEPRWCSTSSRASSPPGRPGYGREQAANIGLTVLGRGEFSLILAALGRGAGLDHRVEPFVAVYVLILALVAPILASRSAVLSRGFPSACSRIGLSRSRGPRGRRRSANMTRWTSPPRSSSSGRTITA